MKFLIVDWPDNDMAAIFKDNTLDQVANTYKENFLSELQSIYSIYDLIDAKIKFVDYQYIIDERIKRGYDFKPILY